jgi:hypothetical protein
MTQDELSEEFANMRKRFHEFANSLGAIATAQAVQGEQLKAIGGRLGKVESAITWAVAVVMGGVLVAVLGSVLRSATQ